MGLFDTILASINDPQRRTQSSDLAGLLQGIQSLAGQQGASEGDMQSVIAALGRHVKSGLQEVERDPTPETAEGIVNKVADQPAATPDVIERLFGQQGGEEKVAEDVSRKTGFNTQTIMAMLPVVLPMVMKLLQSGGPAAPSGQTQAATASGAGGMNPILQGFLDSDKDGDVDLNDVLKMAGPFLSGGR